MKKLLTILLLILAVNLHAQDWSKKLAETAMTIWKDSFMLPNDKAPKWRYDQGVILKGIEGIWNATGDGKYFARVELRSRVPDARTGSTRKSESSLFATRVRAELGLVTR